MSGALRRNWRVVALVIIVSLSLAVLFAPTGTYANADEEGMTNLQYGIELDGGARIRAPVTGYTAENVDLSAEETGEFENTLEDELGVRGVDLRVRVTADRAGGTSAVVEVFDGNVTRDEFVSALDSAGADTSQISVRRGVTEETLQTMVETIERKINVAGLSGGNARIARTAGGERFVVVEAPGRDVDELRELIQDRGEVRVRAYYPGENDTYQYRTVMDQEMEFAVGPASHNQQQGHYVPITFESNEDAQAFVNDMQELGLAQGGARCPFGAESYTNATPPQRCLVTVFNDDPVHAAGVDPGLGNSWADETWLQEPDFIMRTQTEEEARDLQISLAAGRLPANLDFERGDQFSLEPALAQQFKTNSLIVGVAAVIAVALTVFLRYGQARVAAPMVVTALSEVIVLMGFAAGIGYPLDLAVIAGFIAVIGTGVDDLIIIADGVMAEGDVRSARVFQSRFRKAFWVIGAAAATTIIAMSPLAVLSLGDLQGFAIVTILGVLVGVFITRPAYGDILRRLTTGGIGGEEQR